MEFGTRRLLGVAPSRTRVGEADPVVGRLHGRFLGLRPVLFWSPYEAAAWALIGHRVRITQAAAVNARMAEELGETVVVHGEVLHAFPTPNRLADLECLPRPVRPQGEYLHGLARATLAGNLDAAQLRAPLADDALAAIRCLPGSGAFSAEPIRHRRALAPLPQPGRPALRTQLEDDANEITPQQRKNQ